MAWIRDKNIRNLQDSGMMAGRKTTRPSWEKRSQLKIRQSFSHLERGYFWRNLFKNLPEITWQASWNIWLCKLTLQARVDNTHSMWGKLPNQGCPQEFSLSSPHTQRLTNFPMIINRALWGKFHLVCMVLRRRCWRKDPSETWEQDTWF